MKRLRSAACLLVLVLWGCGARVEAPKRADLAAMRQSAAKRPNDAQLHKRLAEAEMFHPLGKMENVGPRLERARALLPHDMRLHLLAGIEAEAHGRPQAALDGFKAALAAFAASDDPHRGHMAEFSVQALAALEGGAVGYALQVERALAAVVHELPVPARWAATDLRIHLAYLRNDGDTVRRLAAEAGCVTTFATAGPFGPRDLLAFDKQHGVDVAAELAATYDLGPARGVRATRTVGARGCTVNLGGDPVASGGVRYATAVQNIPVAGRYYLRFDSPNAVEVFLDGRSVLRVDRRREPLPRALYLPVQLSAGAHRLTLKISSRHPDPVVRIAWLPVQPADTRGDAAAIEIPSPGKGPFALYLRATLQLLRGDTVGARHSLSEVTADARVSPLLLSQHANALFNDPLSPSDVRQDQGRRLLVAALKRDPNLWNPAVQLASLAANNGRVKEAIASMRETHRRFADVPAIGLSLIQMLDSEGWYSEIETIVAGLRKRVPDACPPMLVELEALQRRYRYDAMGEVSERIMECNSRSNARYSDLMRRRDWQGALRELARLSRLDPPQSQFGWKLAEVALAKRAGDQERFERANAELRDGFPRYAGAVHEAFDMHLARGQIASATELLDQALREEPSEMSSLWPLRPLVGRPAILQDFRRDGLSAIAAFEKSGRSYTEPQVLVFDYMATRIFEDGSSMELVHTVQRAQSDEAVDELAEVEVPEGARVLKLRTIKADGRVLEPDVISGKETLSLPSVGVGDYVEFEYMREHGPSNGFPGGYLSDRFYFQSFEIPFDHSEMVFIAPKDMVLTPDPRGEAPSASSELRGDLRVTRFLVTESNPLAAEPGSVTAREYIPSVRVGLNATWPAFVNSVREVLADRDVVDPELVELAADIVGEAAPDDHLLRAQRLYAWVLENVKNNSDSFSQAAVMLRARTGNSARILHYLLGLAGVPATLAIARSAAADTTKSNMPDTEGFEHLLVRVDAQEGPVWLFTSSRYAPFGYLPALLRGQPARLLIDGAPLVGLPNGEGGHDRRSLDVVVDAAESGSTRIEIVERVGGSGAIAWRSQFEEIPPAELERRFEQDYVARLVPGATLSSLRIAGRTPEHPFVTLTYSFTVEAFGRRVREGWALPSMLTAELAANYARMAGRTTTLLVTQPLDTVVTLRYRFPDGAKLPKAPKGATLTSADGRANFALTAGYDGRDLVVQRKLELPIMRVPKGGYPRFAEFCRAVDAAESRELVFGM